MALWGNNDNIVSSGSVSLNYSTKTVTGAGTTFGTTGFGEIGDVIRFGSRPGTFFWRSCNRISCWNSILYYWFYHWS